jgi:hypothetical protein
LQTVDKPTIVRTLNALWEYREAVRLRAGTEEKIQNAHGRFLSLIDKISGDAPKATAGQTPPPAFDRAVFAELLHEFQQLSQLQPQPRGYAFEAFLIKLFNKFGLEAREPFRTRGEQIDGSFVLANEIYLLEAKWQNVQCAIGDLHTFHGKVEQKAAWTRGLMISYSGFSEDGLDAFGRGKRVVCMEGLDIYEMLNRELPLPHVLERKIRRAAETGCAFIRLRELFL